MTGGFQFSIPGDGISDFLLDLLRNIDYYLLSSQVEDRKAGWSNDEARPACRYMPFRAAQMIVTNKAKTSNFYLPSPYCGENSNTGVRTYSEKCAWNMSGRV